MKINFVYENVHKSGDFLPNGLYGDVLDHCIKSDVSRRIISDVDWNGNFQDLIYDEEDTNFSFDFRPEDDILAKNNLGYYSDTLVREMKKREPCFYKVGDIHDLKQKYFYFISPVNAHAPEHIFKNFHNIFGKKTIELLKYIDISVVIYNSQESFIFPYDNSFDAAYSFLHHNDINPNKIKIYSMNYILQNIHETYCNVNNIKNKMIFYKYLYDPQGLLLERNGKEASTSFFSHPKIHEDDFLSTKNTIREKRFLSFNNSPRLHRTDLIKFLDFNNLVDNSYVSYKPRLGFWPDKKNIDTGLTITDSVYKVYLDSYLNITTETWIDNDQIFCTEKIFKPLGNYQPFIVIGSPFMLRTLRENGYKTFSGYIDESYDEVEDYNERIKIIYSEILRISKFSNEEIHEWYWNMENILIFNANHYLNFMKSNNLAMLTKEILNV